MSAEPCGNKQTDRQTRQTDRQGDREAGRQTRNVTLSFDGQSIENLEVSSRERQRCLEQRVLENAALKSRFEKELEVSHSCHDGVNTLRGTWQSFHTSCQTFTNFLPGLGMSRSKLPYWLQLRGRGISREAKLSWWSTG